jgi:DedD protein
MEKKTRHRIIGMLVVAASVIILLPVFQGPKTPLAEADVVKAPPFPNQDVQVSTNTPQPTTSPATPVEIPVAPAELPASKPEQSIAEVKETPTPAIEPVANAKDTLSEETIAATPTVENKPAAQATPEVSKPKAAAHPKVASNKKVNVASSSVHSKALKVGEVKMYVPSKQVLQQVKPYVANSHLAMDKNGLLQLKDAAWVIQLGSFKNKANALHLVNQLRANGYRAFIQQVSSFLGEDIRVYVGPELKQASARAVANRLEQDLHVHGIVVSYKPLAL